MQTGGFVRRHGEILLIVTILIVVSGVFHWVPNKLAFLSFFFLPVLIAGYLLDTRRAVLCAVMCLAVVLLYFFWLWAQIALRESGNILSVHWVIYRDLDTLLSIAIWGGFLILTGTLVGRVHEKMVASLAKVNELNQELNTRAAELEKLNQALQASTDELQRRGDEMQEKNLLIEKLKTQVEETLYSTMDSTVARLLIQGRLRQEKRDIAVLFCDLRGFTEYSQTLHPEVILDDLNHFYGIMEELIETYRGHIDKYIGDGIMCEFGAPVEYQQHSLQAVVAALKMQQRFREEGFPWGLRVGIASGETIVGLLGRRRRSYSAIGEVVNLAKRLEGLCEAGLVYIDETTYKAIEPLVVAERVRNLGRRRDVDKEALDRIAARKEALDKDPNNADLLFELGKLYFDIREASEALHYFQRALQIRPDDTEIKVAFADASVKRDEYEKIMIRGLSERRAVFNVLRLMNPLQSADRFPPAFYDRYKHAEALVEIPDDVTLPTEILDGTIGHSLAVAVLSYAIADRLGRPDELKRHLLVAGRLQDLGKAAVWHHILNRRGGLSEQERKDLESHVNESVALARRMGYDQPEVVEIIANHHELLNGEGYPRGISGVAVPPGACISCVADVYCALTGWRPYRDSWDRRIALNELRKESAAGKYDPKVVEALVELVG